MENNRTETNNENVERIQEVMKRLSLAINVARTIMPERLEDYVPNALLNVTIDQMIRAEGRDNTAILLSNLSDLLSQGLNPENGGPIQLSGKPSRSVGNS
jgi:hypothetical protein